MQKIVHHSCFFPVAPEVPFAAYLDPVQHAAFIGAPVRIAPAVGAMFEAFDGRIHGRILLLVPNRQIVQSWRSFEWQPEDPDSFLILSFFPERAGTRLELAQLNVPERLFSTLQANWPMRYLDAWQRFHGSPG